jgi:hypothetical protein
MSRGQSRSAGQCVANHWMTECAFRTVQLTPGLRMFSSYFPSFAA